MREDDSVGQFSRREFLQFSGIALLASRLDLFDTAFVFPNEAVYQGRALGAAVVYHAPGDGAPVVRTLWPDSITPLLEARGDWYRVPDGWIRRELLQPMTPYTPPDIVSLPDAPFWAEVTAPVAPVRAWCAADAPLVTRVGHGGVALVIDALPADQPGMAWYGIADATGELLGWTPGVRWEVIKSPPIGEGIRPSSAAGSIENFIEITLSTYTLTAWEDNTAVLTAPVSLGADIQPASCMIQRHQPAITWSDSMEGQTRYGVPWALDLGAAGFLTGAYWHNRFGAAAPGPALQGSPALARWLYHWLNDDSAIIIKA